MAAIYEERKSIYEAIIDNTNYLNLQKEYEEFVAKAIELDGNPMWLPGNDHSYISKSVSKSIVLKYVYNLIFRKKLVKMVM